MKDLRGRDIRYAANLSLEFAEEQRVAMVGARPAWTMRVSRSSPSAITWPAPRRAVF